MGVIVPLFLILEQKKKKLLQSLEKRLCCGIKDWGISERRVFDYYMVKVWLKVCLTSLWILISVNIVYMGSKSGKIPLWCNEGRRNFTASAQ
jgi:hypothetical protein